MQVGPTALTYIVSSLWHGLDPGFFVFFVFIGILDTAGRLLKTTKIAVFLFENLPYTVIFVPCWLMSHLMLDLLSVPFMFKDSTRFMPVLASFYYIPIWWPILLLVIGILAPKRPRNNQTTKTGETKEKDTKKTK